MALYESLLGLVALICAVWVIYDVWANKTAMNQNKKIVWTIFAVIFSIITAIVYYFVEKR